MCSILVFFCSGDTFAKQEPRSIAADSHIKAIHKYTGFYGYQSSILFEPGEVIQNLSMGDSTGWQLVLMSLLLEFHAEEATGLDDPRLAYEVRFLYPLFNSEEIYTTDNGDILEQASPTTVPDMNDIEVAKKGLNFNYSISHIKGSESIVPTKVFDDGKFTYLQFNKINSDFPAILWLILKGMNL
ncbi:unnamed protein product [Ceratitis capitata]|uniref:(Mediterranean fruit fly) hypothetical protein n=1 Tax=Ceratitis capitata TaxID=7213 RepID=A0A811UUP0_CERCA|nr:unnamed protein product [Ceratitis capitata]